MNPIEELKRVRDELTSFTKQYKSGDVVPLEKAARLDELLVRGATLAEVIDRGQKSAETMSSIASGNFGVEEWKGGQPTRHFESKSEEHGFLDLSPSGVKSIARTMAAQATESKALLAGGSTATPVALAQGVVRMGGGGLAFLAALPVIKHDTPTFKYLRQTVRTNNAAAVAAGGTKPTSVVTATEIPGSLTPYATLSEPVDKYLLRDNSSLERFIGAELIYMVSLAIQSAAITAFLGTSGIQSVSAAASPIVSVRKGIQAVEDLGFEANLIVLNSADYFDIVTTRNSGGTFDVSGGVGADEEAPKLWGRQVVSVTSGITAGSALVLDRSAVALDMDTVGFETEWNPYVGFAKNTLEARVEARAGFSVFQPSALALTDLAVV